MKVFNSTLAAIGLAAFVFASCSDSTSDPTGGNGVKSEVNSVELTALTPSSVINYKNSTAMARKFFATRNKVFCMPFLEKIAFLCFKTYF